MMVKNQESKFVGKRYELDWHFERIVITKIWSREIIKAKLEKFYKAI